MTARDATRDDIEGNMLKKTTVCFFMLMVWAVLFNGYPTNQDGGFSKTRSAYAQDDWNKEFEDICSRTQDVMSFSIEELKDLMERCERLKPSIEKLDDTRRRVYLKRLKMCRDLFAFALESKMKEE